jgi:hypothetical protein
MCRWCCASLLLLCWLTNGTLLAGQSLACDLRSDSLFFRTTASGLSRSAQIAEQKAVLNAKGLMAGLLEEKVKNSVEQSIREVENNEEFELSSDFRQELKSVAEQILQNCEIVCREQEPLDGGRIRFYVGMEMPREKAADQAIQALDSMFTARENLRTSYKPQRVRAILLKL